MKKLNFAASILIVFLLAYNANAADQHSFPEGEYRGSVFSSGSGRTNCDVNRVDLRIEKQEDHSIRLFWEETGWKARGGFCYNNFDAVMTPKEGVDGEWNIRFVRHGGSRTGWLTYDGEKVQINASINTPSGNQLNIWSEWDFSDEHRRLDYDRDINSFNGWLTANGRLNRRNDDEENEEGS